MDRPPGLDLLELLCVLLQHQRAVLFLEQQTTQSAPFFMMLSTPACHAPFTPAPQFNNSFPQARAPRDGNFDVHGKVFVVNPFTVNIKNLKVSLIGFEPTVPPLHILALLKNTFNYSVIHSTHFYECLYQHQTYTVNHERLVTLYF